MSESFKFDLAGETVPEPSRAQYEKFASYQTRLRELGEDGDQKVFRENLVSAINGERDGELRSWLTARLDQLDGRSADPRVLAEIARRAAVQRGETAMF